MADYAIGDVQGCFDSLCTLLDKLHFDEHQDRLWFVGDLVNRGPKSLEVLRFVKNLPIPARISLGNHDLHLLSLIYSQHQKPPSDPSLAPILVAEDCAELGEWLVQQPLIWVDPDLHVVMVHAGIAPQWNVAQAQLYAQELEITLHGPNRSLFLTSMYANYPHVWTPNLTGMDRLRLICNYLTRMRFCTADGGLDFQYDGPASSATNDLYPWFKVPNRKPIAEDLIFGHWSALEGHCDLPNLHALDTGCVWGGRLTALRLQDKYRISIASKENTTKT